MSEQIPWLTMEGLGSGGVEGGGCAGTLQVRALGAWVQRSPDPRRTVVFGRSLDDVHLVVGGDGLRVSRRQGVLSYRAGCWWISNVGRPPIRMADRLLFTDEEPVPLPTCFTPLGCLGARGLVRPRPVPAGPVRATRTRTRNR